MCQLSTYWGEGKLQPLLHLSHLLLVHRQLSLGGRGGEGRGGEGGGGEGREEEERGRERGEERVMHRTGVVYKINLVAKGQLGSGEESDLIA